MLSETEKRAALDQVKVELRSILLSSKHGVAEHAIKNDYELLTCQRLPIRDLGFKDVASLMRSMPDVAREVRSPNGEITYHAVSDESTAHIQKLVSNQTTKQKKPSRGRGRGRGRGGFGRGGAVRGRGGIGNGGRGGRGGLSKPFWGKPRPPRGGGGRPPLAERTTSFNSMISDGSGDARNKKMSGDVRNFGKGAGFAKFYSLQSSKENAQESAGRGNTKPVGTSRAIVGRGAPELDGSQFEDSDDEESGLNSGFNDTSPIRNLKIGVNRTGERFISDTGSPMVKDNDPTVDNRPGASAGQKDLRDVLNQKRAQRGSSASDDGDSLASGSGKGAKGVKGMQFSAGIGRAKRVAEFENQQEFRKNLPPRFQKKPQREQHHYNTSVSPPPDTKAEEPTRFHEEKENQNWEPPENGELYLKAFFQYFADRGERAPEIEVCAGKYQKQKGFYGRFQYNDKLYFPLAILRTEEQARQNAARSFCLTNSVPLPAATDTGTKGENGAGPPNLFSNVGYTPSWPAGLTQQLQSLIETHNPQKQPTSRSAPSQQPAMSQSPFTPSPQLPQPSTPSPVPQIESWAFPESPAEKNEEPHLSNVKEKIYKMLKPNGVWVQLLPKLYEATYQETLDIDFLSMAGQWTDCFLVEQPTPNRYIVYPIQDAQGPKTNNNTSEINANMPPGVPVPPSQMPPVGSKLDVIFSFAYSATDLYVQRADMEVIVYEIEEVLNQACPAAPVPDVKTVAVNSLVAATYEEGWYRAQVKAVEQAMVKVYFIDYGNTETVCLTDLRPIPEGDLSQTTPPLAIRCALRKTQAGDWFKDVSGKLTAISEHCPHLTAVIVEHSGDRCIIDLSIPGGELVNSMLIQDESPSQPAALTPRQQLQQQPQQLQQQTSLQSIKAAIQTPVGATPAGPKLFADDPEPLVTPDDDEFAVYVCRVMSERSVLLRIVDEEYSDKLDELEMVISQNFYSWPLPKKINPSNIYAGMVFATADDAEDLEEGEKLADQNKYCRVRVLKENKNGSCECYLPDHGHHEVLSRNQLREIDPQLNTSLSYQTILASLHGLDDIPDRFKPMVVKILIKLLMSEFTPFYAVKKGHSAQNRENDASFDPHVVNRVRKIIMCMKDIDPAKVADIYHSVFREPVDRVEEIIKQIPGYGFWRETLEVTLYDTSHEEEDLNINDLVLTAVQDMIKAETDGRGAKEVFRNLFGSCSTSITETESAQETAGSTGTGAMNNLSGGSQGGLEAALNQLSITQNQSDNEARLDRVRDYVRDLPISSTPEDAMTGKSLYTWGTRSDFTDSSIPPCHTPDSTPPSSTPSLCDNPDALPRLPQYWSYPMLTLVSVHIVHVESPSDFTAIPMEQRGALEKMEAALTQYFSLSERQPATALSNAILYAVKLKDIYRRALFVKSFGNMIEVLFPDHHCFDTVTDSDIYLLPEQFYSLPFLAYRMRLGGILPTSQDWPADVVDWFKKKFDNQSLFAIVTGEEGNGSSKKKTTSTGSSKHRVPPTLVVRLIDTSGEEDVVVTEYMEENGMALCCKESE